MDRLLVFYTFIVYTLGESCIYPTGQQGECVPIRSCPSLLWSFTNPKYGVWEELRKFKCSDDDDNSPLLVCCRTKDDMLVFENEEDNTEVSGHDSPVRLTNVESCGTPKDIKIDNGVTRLEDFPWLVKLIANEDDFSDMSVACTGVLINHRNVLYSAQCYYAFLWNSSFVVKIDTYNGPEKNCNQAGYSSKCRNFEIYSPEVFDIHFFYDPQTKLNDIGMLRLHARVPFLDHMQPICLPLTTNSRLGETLYTAGWSRTLNIEDVSVKRAYVSKYISNEQCEKMHSVSTYEICTESADQRRDEDDTIGLPLMAMQNNRWYIYGFQSRKYNNTRIHTRVQNYWQWIQGVTGGERCDTPDNEKGECMHTGNCIRLTDVVANALPIEEDALSEFICQYSFDEPGEPGYSLKVCCGLEPNFTISLPKNENVDVNLEISKFEYCGYQHRDDYFSSNDEVSVDEFPWLAVIFDADLPDLDGAVCAGSLITNRYVLTSAVCLSYFNNETETLLVGLGHYNAANSTNCVKLDQGLYDCNEVQVFMVEENITHPFFNPFDYTHDIALLRLNKTVQFSDYVRPICLPRSEEDVALDGETLFITGFGRRDDEGFTNVKKKIRTTFTSIEACRDKLKHKNFILPVTEYQRCTEEFKNSTDITCVGGEGGPVMFSRKLRWFIEGITSIYQCGRPYPTSYVRVYKYLKWIKSHMKP